MKPFIIQESPEQRFQAVLKEHRVDFDKLFADLQYPVVWSYDRWLNGYTPGELSTAGVERLRHGTWTEEIDGPALRKAGLFEPHRPTWEQLRIDFQRDGLVRLPSLFAPEYAAWLSEYFYRQPKRDRWPDMEGIVRTSLNDLPVMRLLHQQTEALISYVISEKVTPSYSFTSGYEAGSNLPRHTDRPQCVYNISIVLSIEPADQDPRSWPLWIERDGRPFVIRLSAGDGVLYSGVRDPHWRDTMPQGWTAVTGVFFHYVNEGFAGSLS